ncbi:hypothetical protein D3C72_1740470 [compost metagenome]
MHHTDVAGQTACNADHRFMVFFGDVRHANRHFAVNALAVESPFAGEHQGAVVDMFFEVQRLGDNLNPTTQLRAEKRHQRRAHSPCRAGAWDVFNVNRQRFLNHVSKMAEIAIEFDDLRLISPFLRTKYA